MSVELLDDLEAGELSVEFEGEEPEVVLEWAIAHFSPSISISTAFQTDGAVLLHMAYEIDPSIRMFSVDTGRLPSETFELIEQMRDRYPGLQLDLISPAAPAVNAMVKKHGPNLFYNAVERRMLCCQVRKVLPLQAHLAGLDAWITGLRRDQWATRSDIRKVEIDHDHGAIVKLPARGVVGGRGVGLRARARPSLQLTLRQGLHLDRLRAVHTPDKAGRGLARRPLVVGDERAEGVRDPLRDRDRRARARAACIDRRGRR